jgi:hypothetical protein
LRVEPPCGQGEHDVGFESFEVHGSMGVGGVRRRRRTQDVADVQEKVVEWTDWDDDGKEKKMFGGRWALW